MSRKISFGTRTLFFSKHAELATDIRTVDLILRGALNFLELQKPRLLFRFRNVIMKLRCRCSRAFRVFEDVETVVLTLSDKLDRLLEVLIGLAREADDDVARERQTSR